MNVATPVALFSRLTSLPLALLLALLAGCDKSSPPVLPTVTMQIGGKTYTLEVADNEKDRRRGLMQRDALPDDRGMIFVFNREAPLSFWMKNTRIPLDIVYVDAKGKVVSIKQMKPYDLGSTPSDGPAMYAIELNKGAAEKLGLKAGDTLVVPNGLSAKD